MGSGGSLSVAAFASFLHDLYTGQPAETTTPLMAARMRSIRDASVTLFSAGGSNPDVLGVCRTLIDIEPKSFGVLCLRSKSPLGRLCRQFEFVGYSDPNLPSGKDGFVATNSLVAFALLINRAYAQCTAAEFREDLGFEELIAGSKKFSNWVEGLRQTSNPLWTKDHLLVLYGSRVAEAAAFDIESKFSEAAIGPIQLTDFRNFAHGRHHWLDKHGATTGVLAFVAKDDEDIASRTLDLLPRNIPALEIPIRRLDGYGAMAALVTSLYLSGFAAEARGIDPGRPHVKKFGRRIFHLNVWKRNRKKNASAMEDVAIERKIGKSLSCVASDQLDFWRAAYRDFVSGLKSSAFDALILDYDGTLCDDKFRFGSLPPEICLALNGLLRKGARVGIATGRGDSVRRALRDGIPRKHWREITVAYHNGAEVGNLEQEAPTRWVGVSSNRLQELADRLERAQSVQSIASLQRGENQISVIAKHPGSANKLYSVVCDLIASDFSSGISCVRSAHSVDILAPGLGKHVIFAALGETLQLSDPTFLCVGDLGAWPGNDFQLLRVAHSLSVHEVSHDARSCWNIAPRGVRNSQATRFILGRLSCSRGIIRYEINSRRSTRS